MPTYEVRFADPANPQIPLTFLPHAESRDEAVQEAMAMARNAVPPLRLGALLSVTRLPVA